MLGKILLIRKDTGLKEDMFDYEYLKNSKEKKEEIRDSYSKEDFYLQCGCNPDTKMWINSVGRFYYLKQEFGASSHECACVGSSIYEKIVHNPGWKDTEEGSEAKLGFSLKPNFIGTKSCKKTEENPYKASRIVKHAESKGELTISALAKKINMYVFAKKMYQGVIPKDISEMNRFIYGNIDYFKISEKRKKEYNSLKKIFYSGGNIPLGETRFLYGKLVDIKPLNLDFDKLDKFNLTVELSTGFTVIIGLPFTNLYEEFKDENIVNGKTLTEEIVRLNLESKDFRKALLSKNIIVAGIIGTNKKYKEFCQVGFFKVNKNGLYVESDKEAIMYNHLADNKVYFYKPYKTFAEYSRKNNEGEIVSLYSPDAIIIAPNKSKTIFVEVFGFKSREYEEKRLIKESIFKNELKDSHVLISWDARIEPNPPRIEDILAIIDSVNDV